MGNESSGEAVSQQVRQAPAVPEAIARICALAKGSRITLARVAQRGLMRMEHDYASAMDIIAECEERELRWHAPAKEDGQWLYCFLVRLDEGPDLYLKIALSVPDMESAVIVSYKPDGSPE